MYDSLLEWDPKLNIKPALAALVKVVDSKRIVDFTLKQGVRFHNGKEFTAADAKYSFEQHLEPAAARAPSPSLGQVPGIAEHRGSRSTSCGST